MDIKQVNEDLDKYQKLLDKRIAKYNIPCKGHLSGNPIDGYDYDCDYEKSGEITCDNCICNGGSMNPITGKRVYKRKG